MKTRAKYIRMSPRKVRLVADLVRGLPVLKAREQLTFSKRAAAVPVLKALNSAVANAENAFSKKAEELIVSEIRIDEGPTIKRFQPRARGSAYPIRKRTSHIIVVVNEKDVKRKSTSVASENEEIVETKPTTPKKPTVVKKTAIKKSASKSNA